MAGGPPPHLRSAPHTPQPSCGSGRRVWVPPAPSRPCPPGSPMGGRRAGLSPLLPACQLPPGLHASPPPAGSGRNPQCAPPRTGGAVPATRLPTGSAAHQEKAPECPHLPPSFPHGGAGCELWPLPCQVGAPRAWRARGSVYRLHRCGDRAWGRGRPGSAECLMRRGKGTRRGAEILIPHSLWGGGHLLFSWGGSRGQGAGCQVPSRQRSLVQTTGAAKNLTAGCPPLPVPLDSAGETEAGASSWESPEAREAFGLCWFLFCVWGWWPSLRKQGSFPREVKAVPNPPPLWSPAPQGHPAPASQGPDPAVLSSQSTCWPTGDRCVPTSQQGDIWLPEALEVGGGHLLDGSGPERATTAPRGTQRGQAVPADTTHPPPGSPRSWLREGWRAGPTQPWPLPGQNNGGQVQHPHLARPAPQHLLSLWLLV